MTRRHQGHDDTDCAYCEEIAEARAGDDYDFDGAMADREADRYERYYLDREMS